MGLRRSRSPRPLVLLPGQSKQVFHKHTPEQSSYLVFPPSPTSLRAIPRTPLTPPPRLHLRAVLPSPPLSPKFLKSAPHVPYPWIWRCHKCGQVYKLGVTRRCLHDGHLFCSVPQRPETPPTQGEEDDSNNSSNAGNFMSSKERQIRNAQRRRQKAKRHRRRQIGCTAEFDYSGWAHYNSWRRCIRMHKLDKTAAMRERGGFYEDEEEMHIEFATQKNCWNDCEFPSECHNTRFEAERERRQIQALLSAEQVAQEESSDMDVESPIEENDKERFDFQGKIMEIEEWEAELQRQKVADFETQERPTEEMEKFGVAVYGSEPPFLSPSSSTTASIFAAEETDIVDMERRGLEGEAQMVDVGLGPISSSELELEDEEFYGEGFERRHRKKSIQKIAQLTGLMVGVEPVDRGDEVENSRSPLKEGYTFEEKWDETTLVDKQLEEEERSWCMYRRRVGRGEVGEFGDEDEEEGLYF